MLLLLSPNSGHRPKSESVLNLLNRHSPFSGKKDLFFCLSHYLFKLALFNASNISLSLDNLEATHELLSTIQKLYTDELSLPSPKEDYRIDLGTLESISLVAARRNINLNLLVWDLVDLFGYSPSESMYEDIIMSFGSTKQDENMYSALVDMEANGYTPSRPLLQYLALKVGYSEGRLHPSGKILSWHENDHLRSIHTMNVLVMAHGIQKDINSAFRVYDD